MKFIVLAILCLSAYAQGKVLHNVVGKIDTKTGPLECKVKAGSDLVTEDDKLLCQELALLEESKAGQRNLVEEAITNLIEDLRVIVVYGNDVLPPLDPLRIPLIGPFVYTTIGVRATALINNFNMDGLRWFVLDDVNFSALRLAIGIKTTLPWLTFTGSYDVNAFITLLSHRASGNYRIFINRMEASVDVRMGINIWNGGHLVLRELDIRFSIADVQINIEGMTGSSILNNMINSLVQNAAQSLLVDQLEVISETLSRELFDTINEVLGNFTLEDLIGNNVKQVKMLS